MNGYERYLGVVKGKAVDFLPRLPILMQFAAEYIGSNYGAFASDYRVLAQSNIRCARDFGIDQMNTMSDPYRETQGFGAKIIYSPDTVPRCEKHPLEATKNLAVLAKPDPLKSERMLDRVQAVRLYKQKVGGKYSIMGWVEGPAAEAADLRGVVNFLMDLLDDETYAGELMERCVDVAIEFARVQVDSGADTIGIGDAIASQVSPEVYERLILPRERRLVAALKKMGSIVRLHICGNITHLLSGIATLGIDIVDIDWMVDMEQARKVLGSRVVLAGNIDPAGGIRFGKPETIRETMRRTYEIVGNPFMVNAGCEIPPGTPVENLKTLCEPIPWRV